MDYKKFTQEVVDALMKQDKDFFLHSPLLTDSCKQDFVDSIDKDIATNTQLVCQITWLGDFVVMPAKKSFFGSKPQRASTSCTIDAYWIVDGVESPLPGVQESWDWYGKWLFDSYVSFTYGSGEDSVLIDSVIIDSVYN